MSGDFVAVFRIRADATRDDALTAALFLQLDGKLRWGVKESVLAFDIPVLQPIANGGGIGMLRLNRTSREERVGDVTAVVFE